MQVKSVVDHHAESTLQKKKPIGSSYEDILDMCGSTSSNFNTLGNKFKNLPDARKLSTSWTARSSNLDFTSDNIFSTSAYIEDEYYSRTSNINSGVTIGDNFPVSGFAEATGTSVVYGMDEETATSLVKCESYLKSDEKESISVYNPEDCQASTTAQTKKMNRYSQPPSSIGNASTRISRYDKLKYCDEPYPKPVILLENEQINSKNTRHVKNLSLDYHQNQYLTRTRRNSLRNFSNQSLNSLKSQNTGKFSSISSQFIKNRKLMREKRNHLKKNKSSLDNSIKLTTIMLGDNENPVRSTGTELLKGINEQFLNVDKPAFVKNLSDRSTVSATITKAQRTTNLNRRQSCSVEVFNNKEFYWKMPPIIHNPSGSSNKKDSIKSIDDRNSKTLPETRVRASTYSVADSLDRNSTSKYNATESWKAILKDFKKCMYYRSKRHWKKPLPFRYYDNSFTGKDCKYWARYYIRRTRINQRNHKPGYKYKEEAKSLNQKLLACHIMATFTADMEYREDARTFYYLTDSSEHIPLIFLDRNKMTGLSNKKLKMRKMSLQTCDDLELNLIKRRTTLLSSRRASDLLKGLRHSSLT